MNNLSHYRKGTHVIICPVDKTSPLIEVEITKKATGRGKHHSLVKVVSTEPLDIFGHKHKSVEGTEIKSSSFAWLNPAEWEVWARVELK